MAYNVATLKQKDAPLADGRMRIVVTFTGDAGEPARDRELYVDGGMTALDIRRWAIAEASRMGSGKTVVDALTVGQSFNLAPITATPPTQKQTWFADLARLRALQAAIAAGAAPAASDDALQASLLSRFGSIPVTEADF